MTTPLTTAEACILHVHHLPHSHVNDIHHVWPRGHGGPDIEDNRIVVCPTGHRNIHTLLMLLLGAGDTLPYGMVRVFTRNERLYARLGYQRITQGHM